MNKKTIAQRIKHLRKELLNLTQTEFGKLAGVSKAGVSSWERGITTPERDATLAMQENKKINPKWILEGIGQPFINREYSEKLDIIDIVSFIPLISWVQAGNWGEAVDLFVPGDGEDLIPVTKKVSDKSYALRVQGDSMEPEFKEGTIIIVDPEAEIINRSFVIAKINASNEVTFKQYLEDGGRRYLKPMNSDYTMIDITDSEVVFCGRVVMQTKEY